MGNNTIKQLLSNDIYTLVYLQDGNDFYWAEALPGSSLSSAVWRAYKYDSTNCRILLADGNTKFDNIASNLKELNYS
jgi:hypothetical protein